VASNMERTKFWRAEYLGRPDQAPHFVFRLDGPVAAEDFGKESRFRLWEYGTGDTVRQALWASLRRVEARTYELTANGDVTVTLPGGKLETSADGKTWQPAPGKTEGKQVTATINFTAPGGKGLVFLRVP